MAVHYSLPERRKHHEEVCLIKERIEIFFFYQGPIFQKMFYLDCLPKTIFFIYRSQYPHINWYLVDRIYEPSFYFLVFRLWNDWFLTQLQETNRTPTSIDWSMKVRQQIILNSFNGIFTYITNIRQTLVMNLV